MPKIENQVDLAKHITTHEPENCPSISEDHRRFLQMLDRVARLPDSEAEHITVGFLEPAEPLTISEIAKATRKDEVTALKTETNALRNLRRPHNLVA